MSQLTIKLETTTKCFFMVMALIVTFFLGFMAAMALMSTLIYSDSTYEAPPAVRDTPVTYFI